MQKNLRFCGSPVTPEEFNLIAETVRDCNGLSRTELAYTICELLNWRRPTGALKGHECRYFLEELETKGVLKLSGKKAGGPRNKKKATVESPGTEAQQEHITGKLSEFGPIELELVQDDDQRRLWREWVGRYHYLGCKVPFGAHLRYFVLITRPDVKRVACLQVSSPAWMMAPRDRWIGWSHAQRGRRLQQIVQNSRFLILPWVRIPHLASSALAKLVRRLPADWEKQYAVRPLLMETLVDSAKYQGTCYKAANWIHVGQTTGRGRMDKEHLRHGACIKEVLLYPLCRKAREKLLDEREDAASSCRHVDEML